MIKSIIGVFNAINITFKSTNSAPPETSPPPTDQTGYTQTVTQGGGTGTPDDPAVIIITAKKNVALDSYNNLMAYGGLTGDQYNSAKDAAFAQMSPEERCAALGMEANASAGIDEGCDNGIYQEIGNGGATFPLPPNEKLQSIGINGARLYPEDFAHIVAEHTVATDKKTAFYSEFLNPVGFFAAILGPAMANADNVSRQGDKTTFEANMPYAVGHDNYNRPLYRVKIVLTTWGANDPSHPRVYTAYPISN